MVRSIPGDRHNLSVVATPSVHEHATLGSVNERDFLQAINDNRGIIYKLLNLYVDDPTESEDLYQEILLQVWSARKRFRGDAKFSTWLYKICLYTILTAKRKSDPKKTISLDDTWYEPSSEEEMKQDEQAELLYNAIKQLEPIEKSMITMHLDGFSNPEIAEFFGITVNHCNVKLFRIREKLAKILTPA